MKRSSLWQVSGGKHQRLARASVAPPPPPAPAGGSNVLGARRGLMAADPEADLLIELWSLGLLSAKCIAEVAKAAMLVAPRPAMENLASLGNKNHHRNLERRFQLGSNTVAQPFLTSIPMRVQNVKPARMAPVEYPVPNQLLSECHLSAATVTSL